MSPRKGIILAGGSGTRLYPITMGVSFEWIVQERPEGLAQAYHLAQAFLDEAPSALILGDNIFFGGGLTGLLRAANQSWGNTVFGYRVSNPERYGVAGLAPDG